MPINESWLEAALEKLAASQGEMVVDFTPVQRVDAAALRMMEKLAAAAGEKSVKVVLRGVNVDIYKTLKLVKLTPRFSFA